MFRDRATDSRPSADAHEAYLRRSYFPELDGLRAVCALLVLTAHLYAHKEWWIWLAGDRGVTVFFVLSGFLITTLALREEKARGQVSLAGFYVRRCCRLFPLYYGILGFYCLYLLVLGRGSAEQCGAFAEALPWNLVYCQEVPFYKLLVLDQRDLPFFQSWSLGIEEKFYLVWPILAFVYWHGRRRRRMRGTAILAATFAVVSALLCQQHAAWKMAGRFLQSFYPILIGCLAAFLLHEANSFHRLRRLVSWGRSVPALLFFLMVHFATPQTEGWLRQGVNLLYPIATMGLLSVLLDGEGLAARFFRLRPLVFVGRLSYGVYLLHLLAMGVTYRLLPVSWTHPAWSVLAFALCALLSIAGAWVLSWTIETPFIRIGRRWSVWLGERATRRISELEVALRTGRI
jgi:peptidoglycan/LPS O-acetylase OafA/YrhL